MQKIVLDKNKIDQINLSELYSLLDTKSFWERGWNNFVSAKTGDWQGHYRLLAYLSTIFCKDEILLDLGTLTGASSVALSYNKLINVYSFDLPEQTHHSGKLNTQKYTENNIETKRVINPLSNINYIVGDFFDYEDLLLNASLIFIDIDHSGEVELKLLNFLKKNNWQGIAILDDIKWPTMKLVWDSTDLKKFDISKYGNGKDGTGLINFGHRFEICRID